MKSSTKAACLSAFLFPGSGHLYLKCYFRAFIFMLIAGTGLYLLLDATFTIAFEIANNIKTGNVPPDIGSIFFMVQDIIKIFQEPALITAKVSTIAVWVISTVDAWRVGKKKDGNQEGVNE
jgi:TM2 domain-containing membrane protein YozV